MKRTKHSFNMIEVALALLVISLGLATILTLFPSGLKALRESEASADSAEAAEYFYSYMQTLSSKELKTVSSPVDTAVTATASDLSRITESGNVYVYRKTSEVDGKYVEEFSCVIQVFDAKQGTSATNANSTFAYFPSNSGTTVELPGTRTNNIECKFQDQSSASNASFHAYDVEVSYPANVTRDRRTKRVYRMVLLNTEN